MPSADGSIRIRVGASADRSIDAVFAGVERRAIRAKENVSRAFGASTFAQLGPAADRAANQVERAQKRQADAAAREAARASRDVQRHYDQQAKALNRLAREQDRIYQRQAQSEQRALAVRERQEEAAMRRRVALQNRSFAMEQREREKSYRAAERAAREEDSWRAKAAYRTAYHGVVRYFPGMLGHAGRLGSDLLRGAGLDFSLQSSVSRSVNLESEAVKLSNSAYMDGRGGPAGKRVNPAVLADLARNAAIAAGASSAVTLGGLREFVGRTGDLATAKALLPEVMRLSKATGASPDDIMKFAGTTAATWWSDLAGSDKEAGQRAKALSDILNVGAASGKLGTVEMENLAGQGPKLAAAAQAFSGDKAKNLGEMIALAQMGLAGGAASPTQAATSVAAMVNTLRTPARMKHFAAAFGQAEKNDSLFRSTFGKDFALEAGAGKFTRASDVILASIMAAGSDTAKFKGMWANVQGARSVEGLRQRYLEAGSGAAGIAAVRSEFSKFGGAMSEQELADSFAAAMNTTASKAAQFQEQMDAITAKMASELLPKLSEMAPKFLQAMEVFTNAIIWAADHWATAIGVAFTASIARAGIETILREGIERMIRGGGVGLPGGGGIVGGGRGVLGATAGAVAGGVAGMGAGAVLGNAIGGERGTQAGSLIGAGAGVGASVAGIPGAVIGGTIGLVADQIVQLHKQLAGDWELFGTNKIAHANTPEEYDAMMARAGLDPNAQPQQITIDPTQIAKAQSDALRSTVLRVEVTNAAAFRDGRGGPSIDPTGRDAR